MDAVTVGAYEAKTHFSELLKDVLDGQDVVIARAGVPIARLIPFSAKKKKRQGGQWKGKVHIHSNFDELPAEFTAHFS